MQSGQAIYDFLKYPGWVAKARLGRGCMRAVGVVVGRAAFPIPASSWTIFKTGPKEYP